MERWKHQGRDIFDGEALVAQTVMVSPTIFSGAQANGLAGRIVAILNMTDGMPLELIRERLKQS